MSSPAASTSKHGHDSARKRPRARAVSSLPSRKHGGSGGSGGSDGGGGGATSSFSSSSSPITTTAHRAAPLPIAVPTTLTDKKPKKLLVKRKQTTQVVIPISPPSSDSEKDELEPSNQASSSAETLKGDTDGDSSSSELGDKEKKRRAIKRLQKARKAKEDKLPFVSPLTTFKIKSRLEKGKGRACDDDSLAPWDSQFDELASNVNYARSGSPARQQPEIGRMPWETDEEEDDEVQKLLQTQQPPRTVNGEEVYQQKDDMLPRVPAVVLDDEDSLPPPLAPVWNRSRKARPPSSRNLFEATQQPALRARLPSSPPQFVEFVHRQISEELPDLPGVRLSQQSFRGSHPSHGPGTPTSKSPPVKPERDFMSPLPLREPSPSIPPPLRSSSQRRTDQTTQPTLRDPPPEPVLDAAPNPDAGVMQMADFEEDDGYDGLPFWDDDQSISAYDDLRHGGEEADVKPFFTPPAADPPVDGVPAADLREERIYEEMEVDELESVLDAGEKKDATTALPVEQCDAPGQESPSGLVATELASAEHVKSQSKRSGTSSEQRSLPAENGHANPGNLSAPSSNQPSSSRPSSAGQAPTADYEADISADVEDAVDEVDDFDESAILSGPHGESPRPVAIAQPQGALRGSSHEAEPTPHLFSMAFIPTPIVESPSGRPANSAPEPLYGNIPTSEDESQQCPFCSNVYPICVLPDHVETCEREQITVASSPVRQSTSTRTFPSNGTRGADQPAKQLASIRNVPQTTQRQNELSDNPTEGQLERILFPPQMSKARQSLDESSHRDKGKGKARAAEGDDSDLTSPEVPLRSMHIGPSLAKRQSANWHAMAENVIELIEDEPEDEDIETIPGPSKSGWLTRVHNTATKPIRAPERSSSFAALQPKPTNARNVMDADDDDDGSPTGSIYISKLPKQIREGYYRMVGLQGDGSIPEVSLEKLPKKAQTGNPAFAKGFRRFYPSQSKRGSISQRKIKAVAPSKKTKAKSAPQRKKR